MLPEERLDTLLSRHIQNENSQERHQHVDNGDDAHDGDDGDNRDDGREDYADLQPLLDASGRLTALNGAEPSPDFADRLETLFLATAASLSDHGAAPASFDDSMAARFADTAPPRLGNDYPTLPGVRWDELDSMDSIDKMDNQATVADSMDSMDNQATVADNAIAPLAPVPLRPRPVWRRLVWSALAAALLLAIGATTFTAAAAAGPGTPLYGLHRWEQGVQVSMAGSAADRAKLHLEYAREALVALDAAVAARQTGSTYDDALATYRDEMSAASTSLAAVPTGGDQSALVAQFGQLRAQGRSDLHAALAVLPWAQRITTTSALVGLGDNAPTVTHAEMVYSGHGQHLWRITVTGSGFQPGAILLVNGQPAGEVLSVTPTTLVAQMTGDDSAPLPASIGVANPDNTAAVTSSIRSSEQNDATPGTQTTPGAQPSPTDDHGGDRHGGNSGPGGGSGSSDDGGH